MPATINQYKKDIVSRMGGEPHYTMAIFELSERLLQDPKLKDLYGRVCEVQDLYDMQKEVLDLALIDTNSEEREKSFTRVMLYHYRLFSMGLNAAHFSTIRAHLKNVLLVLWVEPDVIEDILKYFDDLLGDLYLAQIRTSGLPLLSTVLPERQ